MCHHHNSGVFLLCCLIGKVYNSRVVIWPSSWEVYVSMHTRLHCGPEDVIKSCVWLQAVAVESNENGQLTDRLAVHAQQAPILDAWLAKFPTLRQGLPAHQTLPEVATAVDVVAKRILASKAAAAAIKVAVTPTSFSSCSLTSHAWRASCFTEGICLAQFHNAAPPGLGQTLHDCRRLLYVCCSWSAVHSKGGACMLSKVLQL